MKLPTKKENQQTNKFEISVEEFLKEIQLKKEVVIICLE